MFKRFNFLIVLAVMFIFGCGGGGGGGGISPENRKAIEGNVMDVSTSSAVEDVVIILRDSATDNLINITLTDAEGFYSFGELEPGAYTLELDFGGYEKQSIENVVIPEKNNKVILADFSIMPAAYEGEVITVCGKIMDKSGKPLSEAIVSLSGGATTNGIFVSTTTDRNGNYSFRNVVLRSIDDTVFTELTLVASKDAHAYTERAVQGLVPNKTFVNVDQTLQKFSGKLLYSYSFDKEEGFIATGLWNRHLNSQIIFNSAAPNFVSIPPDDASNGASYNSYSGESCFWYGSPITGNYIGTQSADDYQNSGGTSVEPNYGVLVAPPINLLTATDAYLEFKSLFEIEADNPNEAGYDYMMVEISVDGGVTYITLDLLNPYIVIYETERTAPPLSSGGFNKAAKWAVYKYDLTSYVGKNVLIRFYFDTVDNLYNGFRGWYIDDVKVYTSEK